MKLSFIKTLSFGLLATLALGLSACTSDVPAREEGA